MDRFFLTVIICSLGHSKTTGGERVCEIRTSDCEWVYPLPGMEFPEWPEQCLQKREQSPVALDVHQTLETNRMALYNFHTDLPQQWGRLVNNGKTIIIDRITKGIFIEYGALPADSSFYLHEIEFHWPAEHTIRGKIYLLEMQLTFINSIYTPSNAYGKKHGVVKMAVLYREGRFNPTLSKVLTRKTLDLKCPDDERSESGLLNLLELFPKPIGKYYTYKGSETTPYCHEGIQWIIWATIGRIHIDQIATLQNYCLNQTNHHMYVTNRHVQPLNNRQIYLTERSDAFVLLSGATIIIEKTIYWPFLYHGVIYFFTRRCTSAHQKKCSEHVKKWSYPKDSILEPPETWGGICETGRRQSPIRLTFCQSKEFPFRRLILKNYNVPYSFFSIHNNGRGVAMAVPKSLNITVSGGPLDDEYILDNIHWHWNQTEHAMSDPGLILEMHLVHRKRQYRDMREAMEHKNGLVVLGVLHKQATRSSKYLRKVLKNVENIEYPGDYSEVTRRLAMGELLPSDTEAYFTYFGSLTTPPCSESVTWIVFVNYLNATLNDIERFRQAKLSDGSVLLQNFRPVQHSNERTVWINKRRRVF